MEFGNYLNYLSLHGHKTIDSPALWFDSRPFIFQAGNTQRDLLVSPQEVFDSYPALLCRWFEPANENVFDITELIATPPYDLNSLSKKSRNQTRRGLENFQIKRVSITSANLGQMETIYFDNLDRLGLLRSETARSKKWSSWRAVFEKGKSLQVWGAFKNGQQTAFLALLPKFDGMEIILHRSLGNSLNEYPNNALVFETLLNLFDQNVPWISYGLAPFWKAKKNPLHHFKLGMGFKEVYLRERFAINPKLAWLVKERTIQNLVYFFRKLKK